MYVCMHACMYVCMYACMHVCIYIYKYSVCVCVNNIIDNELAVEYDTFRCMTSPSNVVFCPYSCSFTVSLSLSLPFDRLLKEFSYFGLLAGTAFLNPNSKPKTIKTVI